MKLIKIAKIRKHAVRSAMISSTLEKFLSYGPTATAADLKTPDLYYPLFLLSQLGKAGMDTTAEINAWIANPSNLDSTGSTPYSSYPHATITTYLGTLRFIGNLLSSIPPTTGAFLHVFAPIFNAISSSPTAGLIPADVAQDIAFISTTGGTNKAAQIPMFQKLYAKFKGEMAAAAGAGTPLANAINADGLFHPDVLSRVTKLAPPQPAMYTYTRKLLDDLGRSYAVPKDVEKNFERIKTAFSGLYGVGKHDELKQVEMDREKERMRRMNPATLGMPVTPPLASVEETKRLNMTAQQYLDPYFLMSMCIFFIEYYKRLS